MDKTSFPKAITVVKLRETCNQGKSTMPSTFRSFDRTSMDRIAQIARMDVNQLLYSCAIDTPVLKRTLAVTCKDIKVPTKDKPLFPRTNTATDVEQVNKFALKPLAKNHHKLTAAAAHTLAGNQPQLIATHTMTRNQPKLTATHIIRKRLLLDGLSEEEMRWLGRNNQETLTRMQPERRRVSSPKPVIAPDTLEEDSSRTTFCSRKASPPNAMLVKARQLLDNININEQNVRERLDNLSMTTASSSSSTTPLPAFKMPLELILRRPKHSCKTNDKAVTSPRNEALQDVPLLELCDKQWLEQLLMDELGLSQEQDYATSS